jgi:DNA (cytosine-5)-methyltransferase 1
MVAVALDDAGSALAIRPRTRTRPTDEQGLRTVRVAEFFAGIGLVKAALEPLGASVVWANDIEIAKQRAYAANHESDHFWLGDVRDVLGSHLPPDLDLATSSFPCVDLSLAGNRKGLAGSHSGMFYEFARVIEELPKRSRPRVVMLENVHGFATSHGGADLRSAIERLNSLGYSCDVIAVDARHFVPQSRPRLFVIGISGALAASHVRGLPPVSDVRPAWVTRVHARNADLRMHYRELDALPIGPTDLAHIVQTVPADDIRWWSPERTAKFVGSLSPVQAARVHDLMASGERSWRTAYRRTRGGVAVWEIRRDAIAGCLRTTGGGSSKQALVDIDGGVLRVRWMTPLEYARLMGAGGYQLQSGTDNQALFGFGDAVVVDVVRWIGEHYLMPTLRELTRR